MSIPNTAHAFWATCISSVTCCSGLEFFCSDCRPFGVGLRDDGSGGSVEEFPQAPLPGEKVKLAVDDAPGFRVNVRGCLVERCAQRAEAAILRGIADRVGRECVAVFDAGEVPRRPQPFL